MISNLVKLQALFLKMLVMSLLLVVCDIQFLTCF